MLFSIMSLMEYVSVKMARVGILVSALLHLDMPNRHLKDVEIKATKYTT